MSPFESATHVFHAVESSKGWEACRQHVEPGAAFECQRVDAAAEPGQGGYAGYGGAILWLNDADLVLAAVSHKGLAVGVIREMAEDYAANFL